MIGFVYKQVSVVYCITHNQDAEALVLINRVYKQGQDHEEILHYL